MKILSLLKAAFSQDMNLFKYNSKRNSSKLKKVLLPVMLFIIVTLVIGVYAYGFAEMLLPSNNLNAMLNVFMIIVVLLAFVEGIYKSQGILFESKDNDMLFSLPITKSQILFVRIVKLLVFEYLFNLMFLLPAFIVYAYFEKVGISFYLISFLMTILIPIIPTVLSCFIGYFIKLIASKFKKGKIAQTLLTGIVFAFIFIMCMNSENYTKMLVDNSVELNSIITNIYYPIYLYNSLINNFDMINFILLILINILPLLIFIIIGQKFYFKIISRGYNKRVNNKKRNENIKIKKNSKLKALTLKELKRYFSSSVYIFNTSFGLIIGVIGSIAIAIKGSDIFDNLMNTIEIDTTLSISIIFYIFTICIGAMTSITSSSISLEGKTINITKSMPVSEKTILDSKILMCLIIEMPFFIVSDIIFIVRFMPSIIEILFILLASVIMIVLSACIGLIFNLKYPKMDATSDTEVVKQSMSSMLSVFFGMGIVLISSSLVLSLSLVVSKVFVMLISTLVLMLISLLLYIYIIKKGTKKYREINV